MSLIGIAPQVRGFPSVTSHRPPLSKGERLHRFTVLAATLAVVALLSFVAVKGAGYYTLALEDRPLSPLHAQLRSSGTVGLKLGIISLVMFGVLFLYPLRKRLKWLARIGATRRWLRLHVLFGIATPLVVTFHTAFRWHGLAGLSQTGSPQCRARARTSSFVSPASIRGLRTRCSPAACMPGR